MTAPAPTARSSSATSVMRLAYRGPDIVIAMASLIVEGTDVVVHLSGLEKLAAFRGDVRLPAASVRAVAVEPNPGAPCAASAARAPAGRE